MLYRIPDCNRSREEGLVLLLHNYMLPCVIMLPLQLVCNKQFKADYIYRFLFVLYHFQFNWVLMLITCFLLYPITTL